VSAAVSISPAQRRGLAIAFTLVPVALMLLAVMPAVANYLDHRDRMAVLARQLVSYRAAIDGAPVERAAVARLRGSRALNDLVVPGANAAQAAATLQSRISELAASAGANVVQSSSQVLAADGALVELSTRLVLEADITQASRLLYALETARPLLVVRRCVIRDADGEFQNAAAGPNRLQVELDISGYMRPL
jgi:hypothetical protein